jgi:cell wall assembly regulator SMI1
MNKKLGAAVVGVALLAMTGAACGDDDDSASAAAPDRYCEIARVLAQPPKDVDFDTATPDEITAAVKKHFGDHLDDIKEFERLAPDEVAADIKVYARLARHIAETGDISEFDTAENAPAIRRQESFDQRACGIEPPG